MLFVLSVFSVFTYGYQELESSLFDDDKPFITCSSEGELGNGLFRAATGICCALDQGYSFFLPMKYKKKYPIIFSNLKSLDPKKIIRRHKQIKTDKPVRFRIAPSMEINGFPHSYLYFDHHKELIQSLFTPSKEMKEVLSNKFHNILKNKSNYVGLHIRTFVKRFDLGILQRIKLKNQVFLYSPCSFHYYDQAINYFGKGVTYVVFSDNIEIAKKILTERYDCDFIFMDETQMYEDFYLMSFFDRLILSNSSFAWWSAYINKNPEKQIVTPWPWYRYKKSAKVKKKHAICPPNWIEFDQGDDIYGMADFINTLIST